MSKKDFNRNPAGNNQWILRSDEELQKIIDSKPKNWTKKELEASVVAYLEMRTKEKRNEKFVKKEIYRNLSKRFGRSEGSFEYRMQNISFIFDEWGEPWIKGLKPYSHIGENIKEILIALIKEHDPKTNKVRTYFSGIFF